MPRRHDFTCDVGAADYLDHQLDGGVAKRRYDLRAQQRTVDAGRPFPPEIPHHDVTHVE
jgi:hypothetical protein